MAQISSKVLLILAYAQSLFDFLVHNFVGFYNSVHMCPYAKISFLLFLITILSGIFFVEGAPPAAVDAPDNGADTVNALDNARDKIGQVISGVAKGALSGAAQGAITGGPAKAAAGGIRGAFVGAIQAIGS